MHYSVVIFGLDIEIEQRFSKEELEKKGAESLRWSTILFKKYLIQNVRTTWPFWTLLSKHLFKKYPFSYVTKHMCMGNKSQFACRNKMSYSFNLNVSYFEEATL